MASRKRLRADIQAARKAKNSADKAIKRVADIRVPRQARKAKRSLRRKLRKVSRRMAKRIPRLRKRLAAKRVSGAGKAVKWAERQVGTVEQPAGSNWGPKISDWIKFTGYSFPVPWCGCFVAYAAIHEGGADIPTPVRLGYTPYIVADGETGRNGLKAVSVYDARPGDLVVFNFGSGEAKHVGLCVAKTDDGEVTCIEGNTSSSTYGSQDNGGGVFFRKRPVSHVIGVARPDYA